MKYKNTVQIEINNNLIQFMKHTLYICINLLR